MTELNITTHSANEVMMNPMGLDQYVTVEACKEFVQHTTTMNYVWMGLALLGIVGMFIVLWKSGKLPKLKDIINTGDE